MVQLSSPPREPRRVSHGEVKPGGDPPSNIWLAPVEDEVEASAVGWLRGLAIVFILSAVGMAALGSAQRPGPTSESSPVSLEQLVAAPDPGVETPATGEEATQGAAAAVSGGGLPFGPFQPAWGDVGTRFTGGWIPLSPSYAIGDLTKVQAGGASMAVRLSGGRSNFKNSDGTFNLGLWKARLDAYAGTNLEPFIADGTILVHYLIDEPKCYQCWGGEAIPNDVLDEMAAYSKAKWPTMATAVRVSPLDLVANAGGTGVAWPDWQWSYLDAAWSQYSARKGDVVEYAKAQHASAVAQGLGHIVGLNVFNGGDGSSGVASHPDFPGGWAMSPNELTTYGTALMTNTDACAFIMWRYDYGGYTYFERTDINQAITQLATTATKTNPTPCTP